MPFRLALVLTMGVVLVGCSDQPFEAKRNYEYRIHVEAASLLELRNRNGALTVSRGSGSEAVVRGTIKTRGMTQAEADAELLELDVEAKVEGQKFRVWFDRPEDARFNGAAASIEVVLPRSLKVDARTSNGAVSVSKLTDELDVHTSNGAISVSNIQAPVRVHTSNGAIDLEHLAGPVTAESSNGRIELRRVGGDITVRTSNGAIGIDATAGEPGEIELHSSNGAIGLTVAAGHASEIKLRSGNGVVGVYGNTADFEVTRHQRSELTARSRVGGAHRVTARSGNGAIRVEVE